MNPFAALYDGLAATFPHLESSDLLENRQNRLDYSLRLAANSNALADICRELAPDGDVLFFIDQFEETFTSVPDYLRPLFITLLLHAAESQHLRIVLTMRSDFFGRCVEYPKLAESLRQSSFTLAAPRFLALYDMITLPAQRAALKLDDGLAAHILQATGDEPGNLALMAYALDELYNRAVLSVRAQHAAPLRITFNDYETIGGIAGAIGTQAEQAFADLNLPDKDTLLKHVFRELVEVDERGTATRRRAAPTRFTADEQALIQAFTGARLLVTDAGIVEVAHEALFRSWTRLRDWIQAEQDSLALIRQSERDAAAWQGRGKPPELQPKHEQLEFFEKARQQLALSRDRLDPLLREYTEPEAARLQREIEDIETPHKRRFDIGDRLSVIGDPRKGVGVVRTTPASSVLPDIEWRYVEVPDGAQITIKDKIFTAPQDFRSFYIARYLITYSQFQAFVEARDGFSDDRWWQDFPDEYRPQELDTPPSQQANYPRSTVSWYQAVAFCRWLDFKYRNPADTGPMQASSVMDSQPRLSVASLMKKLTGKGSGESTRRGELQIRLPTEWEWQWAATGGNPANQYPWGSGMSIRAPTPPKPGLMTVAPPSGCIRMAKRSAERGTWRATCGNGV